MSLKVLNHIPSGRNQLVLSFYVGNHHQGEERMLHTKRKLGASGIDCLLRPRQQDTKVPRFLPGLHSGFWSLLI